MAKNSRMKPAMRAHYVNTRLLSMKRLERQARNIVLATYKKQKPKVIDFVRTGKSVKQLQHELPYFYKESIKPLWAASLKTIWNNAAEDGDAITTDWLSPNAVRKAWEDSADNWMQEHAGAKIDGITDTDQEWLANTLRSGESEGKSIDEMAQDLTGEFDNMSEGRAGTIARTETAGAYNYASQETATDLMPDGSTKTWEVTSDNPREWHADADGQTVPMEDPFIVMDEEMDYPGDPAGSVENVVNCMCVVSYDLSSGGAVGEAEGAGAAAEVEVPAAEAVAEGPSGTYDLQAFNSAFGPARDHLDTLPDDARYNVKGYTGDMHRNYNEISRTGTMFGREPSERDLNGIATLSNTLDTAPTDARFVGTSYRGVGAFGSQETYDLYSGLGVGETFTDPGFTSTSIHPEIFRDFTGQDAAKAVKLEIQGTDGVPISYLSQRPAEDEVLYNKGTTFVVESTTKMDDGSTYMRIRQV